MSATVGFEDRRVFIATVIAKAGLEGGDISATADRIRAAGATPGETRWIEPGEAFDVGFTGDPVVVRAALEAVADKADVVVQRAAGRAKRLLISDMDSTMITVECIDELADYAGIKAEVAAVTERAMRGELDFEAALDSRVALLRDLDEAVIARCYAERVRIMPGAKALVRTMRAHGAHTLLVSGGFTLFADRVAAEIGFDRAMANVLDVAGGRLAGTVARPIVGAAAKRAALVAEAAAMGIGLDAAMAIGDGANDIAMIEAAGLGVAYHAKPRTAAAADARIERGDLGALLYAQGYPRAAWVA
jgi:phosphoserine phosphatase